MEEIAKQRARLGEIACDIYCNSRTTKGTAILSYGFLSKPPDAGSIFIRRLLGSRYAVVVPHYTGTHDSGGFFDFDDCHKTILKTIDAVKKKKIKVPDEKIFLIGRSLGGIAALMALAESKYINGVVAMCPPTDMRKIKRRIHLLKPLWKIKARKSWRIKEYVWKKAISGELRMNAIEHTEKLCGKSILIIHGTNDKAVPISHPKTLKSALEKNCTLIELKGEGHFGFEKAAEDNLFKTIADWMKNIGDK